MGMVGWYGERDDQEARATIDCAVELGITHLDTAAIYQNGENERFVGQCIKGRRDNFFLATKCGMMRSPDGRIKVTNRAEHIRQSCDESLRRLEVDHIDLFYLHRIDHEIPVEESMGVLAELVEAGKIRFAGLSEAAPETIERANAAHPVAALQSELSLWTQRSTQPALDTCRTLGISFVAYSPLGRGFLTGAIKNVSDLPERDTRRIFPRFSDENFSANLVVASKLREIAETLNCSPAQLALAWVLAQWDGVLPIPGTKKRKYLRENAGAAEIQLDEKTLREISRQLPEDMVHGDRYPELMMGALNL